MDSLERTITRSTLKNTTAPLIYCRMKNLALQKLHPSFALNGVSFSEESLLIFANQLTQAKDQEHCATGAFINEWLNDAAFVTVSTSGSTGKPKVLKVAKQHMINSAKATGAFFDVDEGAKVLLCLSANYIAGKMMLVRAMSLGWNLDSVTPSNNPLQGSEKKYDFCAMVPTQLNNSLESLDRIKTLIVGGAPITQRLAKDIQSKKTKIYETYGMTETVSHIAVKQLNAVSADKQNTYFKTMPKVEVSVDQRSCLVINAPLVATETIATNDMVTLIDPTTFLWRGRFDNVINSGGIKLFPEEIEKKIQHLIDQRFFISWLSDSKLGQQLVLIIENSETTKSVLETAITNDFSSVLTKYEIPKRVFYIKQFIETASGKIQREHNRSLVAAYCL